MSKTPAQRPRHYSLQELAELSGMTIRNVRAYQTRGLIPPPMRNGRRSVYDENHLERLRAIKAARDEGATLNLISSHLRRGGDLDAEGTHLQLGTMRAGSPSAIDRGTALDPRFAAADAVGAAESLERLIRRGLVRRSGGRMIAERPLARGANSAVRHGVPVTNVLAVIEASITAANQINQTVESALGALTDGTELSSPKIIARSRMDLIDLAAVAMSQVTVIDIAAIERKSAGAQSLDVTEVTEVSISADPAPAQH